MIQEEFDRLKRVEELRQHGVNPYPNKANRTHKIAEVLAHFDVLQESKQTISLVGRVRLLRKHGGLTFAQLQDESSIIQIAFKKDRLGEDAYNTLHATVDVADFIEVQGSVFLTQKGEKSLDVTSYLMIAKAILPLPDKWHGLSDTETRFRKRYLDLIMSPEVKDRLIIRSRIIGSIRAILNAQGFTEVETPTLQPIYGGGYARPFTTHHNALDSNFYLRISDEMYLKRLLVGGLERVYEITKVFRNEGIDHDHNPEFTMFEAQIAYENYFFGMDLFEEIFEHAAKSALHTTQVKHEDHIIELARPWKRMRLIDSVEEIGGIPRSTWDQFETARSALLPKLSAKQQVECGHIHSVGELLAFAFESLVEEKLVQPTIIYDYPVEVSPLAKKSSDPRFVERFEVFALGSEIGNNYSELNDPVDLENRFIHEKNKEEAGFDEAHQTDYAYIEAIKHGMPPACGLGIGIDRMVMLLTGVQNIKEVIAFPTLRPQTQQE